jgi:hypothetical protein
LSYVHFDLLSAKLIKLVYSEPSAGYRREVAGALDKGHGCVSKNEFYVPGDNTDEDFFYRGECKDGDTNNDVEEVNAADNIIKMMDGD